MPEHTISHDGGGAASEAVSTPKLTPLSTPEIGPVLAASPSMLSRQSSANTTPRQHNRRQFNVVKAEPLERRSSSVSMDQVLAAFATSTSTAASQETRTIQSTSSRVLPTPKPPSQCPLLCCFYAEFDNKVGPKICYQCPEGFMEQDIRLSSTELENGLHRVFDGADEEPDRDVDLPDNRSADGDDDDTAQFQIFNSCSEYIITGNELTGNILNNEKSFEKSKFFEKIKILTILPNKIAFRFVLGYNLLDKYSILSTYNYSHHYKNLNYTIGLIL